MVSIFIACLGIFGLVSYTARQKTREIGIRKVLGASVHSIVKLLSREFILLIAIASIIGFPAAYLVLRNFLLEFAFRTSIGFDVFIVSTGAAVALALITISFQAIKAAQANPVDTLRHE